MRLFLSSFGLSSSPQELAALVPARARTAVVANALDNQHERARSGHLRRACAALEDLGLETFELDLRRHRPPDARLRDTLERTELLWLTGGNVFLLREAFARSGLDALLAELLADDAIAYGGYSAGACLAGPTLRGLELVDDAQAVARPIWDGLGLVEFSIVPHHRCDHPESARIDSLVAHLEQHAMPHRTLRDGEAIVVRENHVLLAGRGR
jgi:dipeptidase E